jgi:hypothetical protein
VIGFTPVRQNAEVEGEANEQARWRRRLGEESHQIGKLAHVLMQSVAKEFLQRMAITCN